MKKILFTLLTVFGLSITNGFSQISQNVSPGCVDGVIYLKYKPEALRSKKIIDPTNVSITGISGCPFYVVFFRSGDQRPGQLQLVPAV